MQENYLLWRRRGHGQRLFVYVMVSMFCYIEERAAVARLRLLALAP